MARTDCANVRRHDPILSLILAGIVLGTMLGALIALLKYLADPYNQLPAITYWLLGSLAAVAPSDLALAAPFALAGLVPLYLLRWRMNLLSLSDDEARALGVPVARLRLAVVCAATLMTAAAVAISGIIGWVGLLIPHAARMLIGPEFSRLLPLCHAARRSVPSRRGHARTHGGADRDPARRAHRAHRHAVLPLALRLGEARVAMMLEARKLGYGYPGRAVGRDLELALGAGEVLCVLGPNGGGKTTLFRTLLGLIAAQEGEVRLDGEALGALERSAVARRVGYVPQGHVAQFAFTVRDVVLMGRTAHVGLFAAPGAADRAAAERAIETLGIGDLAERVVTELSGGERQLTMIARALAQGARALVLDEPTASLDFGNQVRVLREIRRLAAEGYAVVFSSHDPSQAFLAASRVLLLARGGALRQGTPTEVITAENLRQVYGVEVRVTPLDGTSVCLPVL